MMPSEGDTILHSFCYPESVALFHYFYKMKSQSGKLIIFSLLCSVPTVDIVFLMIRTLDASATWHQNYVIG